MQRSNKPIKHQINSSMMKDTIGGQIYEVEKEGSIVIITFYPSINAVNPEDNVLKIRATKDDLKKFIKYVS